MAQLFSGRAFHTWERIMVARRINFEFSNSPYIKYWSSHPNWTPWSWQIGPLGVHGLIDGFLTIHPVWLGLLLRHNWCPRRLQKLLPKLGCLDWNLIPHWVSLPWWKGGNCGTTAPFKILLTLTINLKCLKIYSFQLTVWNTGRAPVGVEFLHVNFDLI